MNSVTAADYSWIRSSGSPFRYAFGVGYSLTLVRGVSPEELLTLVGAEPRGECEGFEELIEEHQEFAEEQDDWAESSLVGAFTVPGDGGDWVLALELGGDLGMRPRLMEALSAGTRAVSHSGNAGKPMDFFRWYENGALRTTFEGPAHRSGSTPDELNAVMREVGLDPAGDGDPAVDRKAAVLALAERLAGVRVTGELLRDAEYRTGEVPEEPDEEWTGVVIDVTDAQGERTYVEVRRDQL
ncbi:DUF6461 domain-containing protein [Kitasatospora sp. NBC_00085]|uniref:DUF6461 domain-containing protein n=1 Tax=unclassified Kitasatospora TaxID=2633591 RepID=UPI0032520E09